MLADNFDYGHGNNYDDYLGDGYFSDPGSSAVSTAASAGGRKLLGHYIYYGYHNFHDSSAAAAAAAASGGGSSAAAAAAASGGGSAAAAAAAASGGKKLSVNYCNICMQVMQVTHQHLHLSNATHTIGSSCLLQQCGVHSR